MELAGLAVAGPRFWHKLSDLSYQAEQHAVATLEVGSISRIRRRYIGNTKAQELKQIFAERTVRKAGNTLGQVLSLFAMAEGVAKTYATRSNRDTESDHADDSIIPLVQQMHQLSIKRQNKTRLKQRVKWALYESKEFKTLIGEVSDSVKDLEELFPAAATVRQQLAIQEVEILATPESLPLLSEAASSEEVSDEMLQEAIARKDNDQKSHTVNTWTGTNYGIQAARQDISGGTFNFGQRG